MRAASTAARRGSRKQPTGKARVRSQPRAGAAPRPPRCLGAPREGMAPWEQLFQPFPPRPPPPPAAVRSAGRRLPSEFSFRVFEQVKSKGKGNVKVRVRMWRAHRLSTMVFQE